MKRFIFMLAIAATVFAPKTRLAAAPLDPKDVDDDPAILCHLDWDALRASSIGKSLLSDPDFQNKLNVVAALFDFDLRTQLHGWTIYTTGSHPKKGVLIVYADFDPKRLITWANAADGAQCDTNGSHVIYSWLNKNKKGDDGEPERVYGAIAGHRVIFGQSDACVDDALNVIGGKDKNFSGQEGMPAAKPGEAVILVAAVLKYPFDSADQNSAIFKMSKSVRLKLSEVGNHIDGDAQFEASDTNTATQIAAIAQGLVAVLRLQKTDTNILELANAIKISQDNSAVAVTLSLPTDEVSAKIKEKEAAAKTNNDGAQAEKK